MKKKQYKYILWDIDDTLMDFKAAEYIALPKCFAEYGINLTKEDVDTYSKINHDYWKLLEQGKIEKKSMLDRRFDDFIQYLGVKGIQGCTLNKKYQVAIGLDAVLFPGAYEICSKLKETTKQYAITNGTAVAQETKLRHTGFDQIFDDVFISDLVGYQKPDVRYFESVFAQISGFDKEKALVIGDSLSSDIKGANYAGVDCCWFNPKGTINEDKSLRIHYEVKCLQDVMKIIE